MAKLSALFLAFVLVLSITATIERHYHYHFDGPSDSRSLLQSSPRRLNYKGIGFPVRRLTDSSCVAACKNKYPLWKVWQIGNRRKCIRGCAVNSYDAYGSASVKKR